MTDIDNFFICPLPVDSRIISPLPVLIYIAFSLVYDLRKLEPSEYALAYKT